MSEFDFKLITRPGSQNTNADALSRIPSPLVEDAEIDDTLAFFAVVMQGDWIEDEWYGDVYRFLEHQSFNVQRDAAARKRIRLRATRFLIRNDKLFFRDKNGLKLCIKKPEVEAVLTEYHDGPIGGHFGREITIARIRQDFWWPNLWKDVATFVRTCDICQRYGPKQRHNPLSPFRPIYPFEVVYMDFIVNLPLTSKRNHHLITMTEGLTKWIEAKAVREATSRTAAGFLGDIILRFGNPTVVITDNGTHFMGDFHQLCITKGIEHRYATPYHPQTAGQDERTNGLLIDRARKWRKGEYKKWDEDLQSSIFACNTRKVSTTSFSPMEALMGHTAATASRLKFGSLSRHEIKEKLAIVSENIPAGLLEARMSILESLREEAIRVRDHKANRMKARYDTKVRPQQYTQGQEVLLYDSTLLKQWSRKLDERWLGPFRVEWVGTKGAYAILMEDGTQRMVSGDNLKPYFNRS